MNKHAHSSKSLPSGVTGGQEFERMFFFQLVAKWKASFPKLFLKGSPSYISVPFICFIIYNHIWQLTSLNSACVLLPKRWRLAKKVRPCLWCPTLSWVHGHSDFGIILSIWQKGCRIQWSFTQDPLKGWNSWVLGTLGSWCCCFVCDDRRVTTVWKILRIILSYIWLNMPFDLLSIDMSL